MNSNLQTEILALFGGDAQLAQDLQNAVAYPLSERRKIADDHAKRLYPKGPKGTAFASKTFWRKLADSRLFDAVFCASSEKQQRIAKFLAEERRWTEQRNALRAAAGRVEREAWPPKPVFCKHVAVPLPDDRRGW